MTGQWVPDPGDEVFEAEAATRVITSENNDLPDVVIPASPPDTGLADYYTSWKEKSDREGNPFLTVVDRSGMHLLPARWCRCINRDAHALQAIDCGMFPASSKVVRTVFTFQCLDDFLADSQECNTSHYHYVEKLRRLTCQAFPDTVPNRYQELIRIERQWRYLKNLMWHGFGHRKDVPGPGDLTIRCPACPQPGVNLPDILPELGEDWLYTRQFVMDGNFSAIHLRQRHPENDVWLTHGTGYMTARDPYREHLEMALDNHEASDCNRYRAGNDNISRKGLDCTGIGSVACARHGFFTPCATVDFQKGEQYKNIDYAVSQAVNQPDMNGVKRCLLIYDIMCQWHKNWASRVEESSFLSLPADLEVLKGIGDFHVKGHIPPCTPRFGLSYIRGIGIIDGEILETLWSALNHSSRSASGASLAHRTEILDDHMNYSNWKKTTGIVSTLIKKWKRAREQASSTKSALDGLTETGDPDQIAKWKERADRANRDRVSNPKAMDYFLVKQQQAPGRSVTQLALTKEEPSKGQIGLAAFLVEGIKIQETQIALQQRVRDVGRYPTTTEEIEIAEKRVKLSTRIASYQKQARRFLCLTLAEEDDQSYSFEDGYTYVEEEGELRLVKLPVEPLPAGDPDVAEKFQIALPSSIGFVNCDTRRLSVAVSFEKDLRIGQCNDALQAIRLDIGKKAFIFKTGVRRATGKNAKTRAYSKVHSVDVSLKYHAQLYRRSREALIALGANDSCLGKYKPLADEDLKTTTTYLDPTITGEKHSHLAWFWYIDVARDAYDSNLLAEFYRVNWLRAHEHHMRALEEVTLVRHEMDWTVHFFGHMAQRWNKYVEASTASGHQCYALQMEAMWARFASRARSAFEVVKTQFP